METHKIRRGIISFIFLNFLFACTQIDTSKLKIKFERVDNLETGSKVYIKDFPVGEVTHLELLQNDSILVDIKLTGNIFIPKYSKFILNSPLTGNSSINIERSKNNAPFTNIDTINGFYFKKGSNDNKISDSARQVTIQQPVEK